MHPLTPWHHLIVFCVVNAICITVLQYIVHNCITVLIFLMFIINYCIKFFYSIMSSLYWHPCSNLIMCYIQFPLFTCFTTIYGSDLWLVNCHCFYILFPSVTHYSGTCTFYTYTCMYRKCMHYIKMSIIYLCMVSAKAKVAGLARVVHGWISGKVFNVKDDNSSVHELLAIVHVLIREVSSFRSVYWEAPPM